MKGSIMSAIQHLRIADEYMEDVVRQERTVGSKVFRDYSRRVKWILNDFATFPQFTDIVREGIRKEFAADPMVTEAIREKIALLPAQYREDFEQALEWILEGKAVKIIMQDDTRVQK